MFSLKKNLSLHHISKTVNFLHITILYYVIKNWHNKNLFFLNFIKRNNYAALINATRARKINCIGPEKSLIRPCQKIELWMMMVCFWCAILIRRFLQEFISELHDWVQSNIACFVVFLLDEIVLINLAITTGFKFNREWLNKL